MSPTRINLSSSFTFFHKVVFPIVWIGCFGIGTIALWADINAPIHTKWIFLIVLVVGSLFICWSSVQLKRVWVDGKKIYISNYLKKITLPLNTIKSVSENRWINIHPVTIYFRRPTEFGSKIMFMPKFRMFLFWGSHPVVNEIKRMVQQASLECEP